MSVTPSLPALRVLGLWATQGRTCFHVMRGHRTFCGKALDVAEAAQERRAPGVHLAPSPTTLLPIIKEKARGRAFGHAPPVTTRAREVGVAVSQDDPSVLRAGPFWSTLGKPQIG